MAAGQSASAARAVSVERLGRRSRRTLTVKPRTAFYGSSSLGSFTPPATRRSWPVRASSRTAVAKNSSW
jgi:hypothetical protein